MKTIHLVLRALVVVSRDTFIGFIIGLCAAIILFKMNPATHRSVALLIPAGTTAGFFKGLAKFIILNIVSHLPSKGYRLEYPKFKMLLLWLGVLIVSLMSVYGLNLASWFTGPAELLRENIILGQVSIVTWIAIFSLVSLLGLFSHIYEPPINEDETLPVEQESEDQAE